MQRGMWVAASALNQHQKALEVLDNNLSNVNTTGYKSSRAIFADVFSQTIKLGGAISAAQTGTVNPMQVGYGAEVAAITKNFNQGDVERTGRTTDLALSGSGMFVMRPPNGSAAAPFYSRSGHFSVDANNGTSPAPQPPGPIKLVSSQGYTLQGINATIDPVTGRYVFAAGAPAAYTDITFNELGTIGPMATSTGSLGANLDANQPLVIDPIVNESFRVEFKRASFDLGTDSFFYFNVQNPVQNLDGSFTTLNDSVTGQRIAGVIRVNSLGNIVSVRQNTAGTTPFISAAAAAALPVWANVNGAGNPIFTTGAAPLAVAGEVALRPAVPASVNMNLTAPAAFNLSGGAYTAGSLSIVSNGRTLVPGVDYTENAATGLITPLTAWGGPATTTATYVRNGAQITSEPYTIANAAPNINFSVANGPIQPGTLVINATRNGAPLVENTDYSVDYAAGKITVLRHWNAAAPVTVNYTRADTRVQVEHNRTGSPSFFGGVAPEIRSVADIAAGTSMSAIDSLGNEHSLTLGFERLADRQWVWQATPLYRYDQDATAIVNSAQGGGVAGRDGMMVMPNTLIQKSDGTYDIDISIDEGSGLTAWKQIASASPFPSTNSSGRFFKVVSAVTGEVAFSRDITTTDPNFSVQSLYKANASVGSGTLTYTAAGLLDGAQSTVITPISFMPQNAAVMTITLDFADTSQTADASTIVPTAQDGFVEGEMRSWSVDANGFIVAQFDNGLRENIARIGLARFRNPEGLQQRGETHFIASSSSGVAENFFADDSTPLATRITPESLELSNVDLSIEMTNLILFQRSYQFNSRIVTAADELMKEAIGLKR